MGWNERRDALAESDGLSELVIGNDVSRPLDSRNRDLTASASSVSSISVRNTL